MPSTLRQPSSSRLVSVAACAVALPGVIDGGQSIRLQIFPAGRFAPQDGRTEGVSDAGYWYIDAAVAARLIERAQARATKICVDYEHQILHAEKNGQPAPAAAWIDQSTLEWVDGEGLFAIAELTARAREMIAAGEMRYFSPVFFFDKQTGEVLDLKLGALTNFPGLDGMQPLAVTSGLFAASMAALSHPIVIQQETLMDDLVEQLRWLLGLPVGSTAADCIAQLDKLKSQLSGVDVTQAAAASFDLSGHLERQARKIVDLEQRLSAAPDPAAYVPVSLMRDLQLQVASLSHQVGSADVDRVIDDAIASGRLLPAQRDWADSLGKKDLAALKQYLESTPPIKALAGTQSRDAAPNAKGSAALDDIALSVCRQLGLTADEFAKGVAAQGA